MISSSTIALLQHRADKFGKKKKGVTLTKETPRVHPVKKNNKGEEESRFKKRLKKGDLQNFNKF